MSRRREPRIQLNVEVKVWGMDTQGKPFIQRARTLDTTSLGARLAGIGAVQVGEILGVQCGEKKARFKVVWVGRENTPKAGQIGVQCLEPDKAIFGLERGTLSIAGAPAAPAPAWQGARQTAPLRRDAADRRRKFPRYACNGGVELRLNENSTPIWANLNDLSMTGCYVESASTLPAGNTVLFFLRTHDLSVRGRAVVKTSHPSVGMGLGFLHLGSEDQQNLEFLLGTLAGTQELRPEKSRTFVPADAPAAVDNPFVTTGTSPKPQGPTTDISSRIPRAIAELNELGQSLIAEKVEPRLISEFHDAMEHTRQTAWTIQQWIDLRNSGGDTFGVFPQLEAERMHLLMKLARNVMADIDATSINEFSEGIAELYETIQQIHRRLARMFAGPQAEEDHGEGFQQKREPGGGRRNW